MGWISGLGESVQEIRLENGVMGYSSELVIMQWLIMDFRICEGIIECTCLSQSKIVAKAKALRFPLSAIIKHPRNCPGEMEAAVLCCWGHLTN